MSTRFQNPSTEQIAALLRRSRTIAVVGLSDDPLRPSFDVAAAMSHAGYRIVPVNPELSSWQGIGAAPSLDAAVAALPPGETLDIVDVFRRPEHVAGIVEDCLRLHLPALWLQVGVVDESAALKARDAGMVVVMDRCIKVEQRRL